MAILAMAQSAGRIALLTSVMMGHTVVNQVLMAVAQDQFTNVTTVKSGVLYGIPNVVKDITTLVAVFALPIVTAPDCNCAEANGQIMVKCALPPI